MHVLFSCMLLSREMALVFLHISFKGNYNTFLHTSFQGNGNTSLAHLFQGKWQYFFSVHLFH